MGSYHVRCSVPTKEDAIQRIADAAEIPDSVRTFANDSVNALEIPEDGHVFVDMYGTSEPNVTLAVTIEARTHDAP